MIEKIMEAAAKTLDKTIESSGETKSIPKFAHVKMSDVDTDIKKADEVTFRGLNQLPSTSDDLKKVLGPEMASFSKDLSHAGIHLAHELIPKFVEEIKTFVINTFEQADQPHDSIGLKKEGNPGDMKNELKFNPLDHISFGGYYYTGPNGEKLYKAGDGHIYDVNGNKVG